MLNPVRIKLALMCFCFLSCGLARPGVFARAEEAADSQQVPVEVAEKVRLELKEKTGKIFSLGLSYYRGGNYEEALSAFQIVASLDPENKEAQKYADLAQDKIGQRLLRDEKSRQEESQALVRKQTYDLYAAALYAIRYGRLEDAVKYLQEVLKWDPRHEGAWRKLVEVRQELERQQRMGLYMKAQELTKSLETIQRWKQELIGAQVDSNTLAAIYEKERRKRELVEEAEKQKTGGQPQPAEELSEDVAKEKARLALLEAEREQLLSDSYAYAQGLLANSRIDEALAEFQEIQRAEPNFRNTNIFIADIYKAKEAEKREVEPPKYTLGPDDIIEINVLSHPEFSGGVVVEGGGEIIMPMLKEVVMANGLTKDELAERIKELLKKYIKDPEVQVVIKGYNSKKWYILGEVASKGEYPLGKTNLTLLEALYAAGLPLEGTSAMRRVILIKPHKTSPRYRSINVFDILYYGRLQDNVRIEPGDIIYVPKTVLSKVNYMVGAIFAPITAMKTGVQDLKGLSDAAKAITPLKYLWEPDKKTTGSAASTTP